MPDSVLNAIAHAATDVNDPAFRRAWSRCMAGLQTLCGTRHRPMLYTASGHGAWEATLVNLLSPGDQIVMLDSGFHSEDWTRMALALGIDAKVITSDRRRAFSVDRLRESLEADVERRIRAVCMVHCETATGVMTPPEAMREVLDSIDHPALLVLDAVSSVGCMDVRMDEWGVDALVGSVQKGLMLPVGISFTMVNHRALGAHRGARLPNWYFNWTQMLERPLASFCGTAPNNLLFGLEEALHLIDEEGLAALHARHFRLGRATRAAVDAWGTPEGPQLFCAEERDAAPCVTCVVMPAGCGAEDLRARARERYSVVLASGLGDLFGSCFRIGHMGDLNEPMLLGTLACVEMAMADLGVRCGRGGVQAASEMLRKHSAT
jgi:alanine-glyoxylate transaminase/serine-glyoxylate transaminase/serine-pyruvate transaminase